MLTSRFPFPFTSDTYQYSNNLKPLDPPVAIQITQEYTEEVQYKRDLLTQYPERCFQQEPYTEVAQWEVLDHLLHELTEVYPEWFRLDKQGEEWTFHNDLLSEVTTFQFGNVDTLPMGPLDFVGRHVQEDLILMGQNDNQLMLEAGQLCFPGNWSLNFDFGMPFLNIHSPVPGLVSSGLGEKIERFLTRIETGKPWTRLNWSLNAGRRLDTSPETFDDWGKLRYEVTAQNVATLVHLRVEEQNLLRLPRSNSILFTIHTYLMPIQEVIQNPDWLRRMQGVFTSLSPELAEYKGLQPYLPTVVQYLTRQLEATR